MTTDKLLEKLTDTIGRNPIFNNSMSIVGYTQDCNKEGADIGCLSLINLGKFWKAYYGDEERGPVCLNPDDKSPNYASFYGKTANEALQLLYNWCKKYKFIKK